LAQLSENCSTLFQLYFQPIILSDQLKKMSFQLPTQILSKDSPLAICYPSHFASDAMTRRRRRSGGLSISVNVGLNC
jgi:hypothetical protein